MSASLRRVVWRDLPIGSVLIFENYGSFSAKRDFDIFGLFFLAENEPYLKKTSKNRNPVGRSLRNTPL